MFHFSLLFPIHGHTAAITCSPSPIWLWAARHSAPPQGFFRRQPVPHPCQPRHQHPFRRQHQRFPKLVCRQQPHPVGVRGPARTQVHVGGRGVLGSDAVCGRLASVGEQGEAEGS
jgi:hypothetical protein